MEDVLPTDAPWTQSPIKTSVKVDLVFAALALAQGEMKDPPKNKEARVPTKAGGVYTYKYADLADLLKIIRPVFAKHGLALLQLPVNPSRGVTIVSRVVHTSGQWVEFELTMPVGDDKPQTLGSAITYGRRYSAAGIAGIAPDEDEDGQAAQDAAPHYVHDEVFDPMNEDHRAALKKSLIERGIPEVSHKAVLKAMAGKREGELSALLTTFEQKKAP